MGSVPIRYAAIRLHHDFDCPALVHSSVAVGDLVEADDPVEDAAGFDLAPKDVREQRFDIGADRSGAPPTLMLL